MRVSDINNCHCFIRHAITGPDREAVAQRLDDSRKLGDTNGIIIAMASLTGYCPARKPSTDQEEGT